MKKKIVNWFMVLLIIVPTLFGLALSQIVNGNTVIITELSPNSGKVGDEVQLTGEVTAANGSWIVWFDIDNSGYPFDSGEQRASGRADSTAGLSANFVVPSCVGSDSGVNHFVVLGNENATRSFARNAAVMNFSVLTLREITVPSTIQLGETIPIGLTITGGASNNAYRYNVQVTRPDGATSNADLAITSNALGEAFGTINYPNQFPSGQATNQNGEYQVLVTEVTPNRTVELSSTVQVEGTPTPTPTSFPNGTPTSTRPTAKIISITPNPATVGNQVTFNGYGEDIDGYITNYRWISSISGEIGDTSTFTADNLPEGSHTIYFEVQDDSEMWSEPAEAPLEIIAGNGEPDNLPWILILGGAIAIGATASGASALWMHYDGLPSSKIKSRLNQKKAEEEKRTRGEEENEEKKNKYRRKWVERPYLVFDANVPSFIMKDTAYTAQLNVKNRGTGKATNVTIQAIENPFIQFKTPSAQIPSLMPGETEAAAMTFMTNQEIRKNIYQLRFRAQSAQTQAKTKNCFMRGGKIALLSDPKKAENADLIRAWLQKNRYSFVDIYNAAHLMTELYNYDLIIVAPEQKMPSKWVQNLCTYVENSQSVLLIDRILTSKPEPLNEILGYSQATYQPLNYTQAALEVCTEHPVTKGFSIGDRIALGACSGNACIFAGTTGIVLAKNLDQTSSSLETTLLPAITVKESGKGKIIHLNFHAHEHLDQMDQLLRNAINWLLWSE